MYNKDCPSYQKLEFLLYRDNNFNFHHCKIKKQGFFLLKDIIITFKTFKISLSAPGVGYQPLACNLPSLCIKIRIPAVSWLFNRILCQAIWQSTIDFAK
jgi:hypothetical protein